MSQSQDELTRNPGFLSWKRLQLSRAKLKASSKTSALLSGFAMVAMVEMQFTRDNSEDSSSDAKVSGRNGTSSSPRWDGPPFPEHGPPPPPPSPISDETLIAFAICTTLLVAVHMLALMISTCILPNIEAVNSLNSVGLVDESPHEHLYWYIELAWIFSTVIGLLLFLLEIMILGWIKFHGTPFAQLVPSVLLIPVFIVFLAFAIHFYKSLILHKYNVSLRSVEDLEKINAQIQMRNILGISESRDMRQGELRENPSQQDATLWQFYSLAVKHAMRDLQAICRHTYGYTYVRLIVGDLTHSFNEINLALRVGGHQAFEFLLLKLLRGINTLVESNRFAHPYFH